MGSTGPQSNRPPSGSPKCYLHTWLCMCVRQAGDDLATDILLTPVVGHASVGAIVPSEGAFLTRHPIALVRATYNPDTNGSVVKGSPQPDAGLHGEDDQLPASALTSSRSYDAPISAKILPAHSRCSDRLHPLSVLSPSRRWRPIWVWIRPPNVRHGQRFHQGQALLPGFMGFLRPVVQPIHNPRSLHPSNLLH